MLRSFFLFALVFVAISAAFGSPAVGAPTRKKEASTSPEDARARAHFKAGSEYFDNGDFREAYDEFRKAMALKKTRAVMGFAASSLRQMGRYDEALDLYEAIVRDYPDLPSDFRTKVDTAIADLTKLVGTVSAMGDAPAGGAIFVDDRLRGILPITAPIRVAQGMHTIRVQKEGFEPIVGSLEVVAEKNNIVTLVAKSRQGRMVIEEKHNWPIAVEIDGKNVGITPWQGLVDPGEHRVRLHGFIALGTLAECAAPEPGVSAQSGVKVETTVQTVSVRAFESTSITIGAEDTDASLRIESSPNGASLRIDGQSMGKTPWEGRLALGDHTVEVNTNGFITARQTIPLERRKERVVRLLLERAPDLAGQRRTQAVFASVGYGVGGVGLGIFAVSGGLAVTRIDDIRARCGGLQCPGDEKNNVDAARSLGTMSTIGIVFAGVGIAAGTASLLTLRPKLLERRTAQVKNVSLGIGPFTWAIKGSF